MILAMTIGVNVQDVPMMPTTITRGLTHLLNVVPDGVEAMSGIGAVAAMLLTAPGHFVKAVLTLLTMSRMMTLRSQRTSTTPVWRS